MIRKERYATCFRLPSTTRVRRVCAIINWFVRQTPTATSKYEQESEMEARAEGKCQGKRGRVREGTERERAWHKHST